jgi:hypothetical protein
MLPDIFDPFIAPAQSEGRAVVGQVALQVAPEQVPATPLKKREPEI